MGHSFHDHNPTQLLSLLFNIDGWLLQHLPEIFGVINVQALESPLQRFRNKDQNEATFQLPPCCSRSRAAPASLGFLPIGETPLPLSTARSSVGWRKAFAPDSKPSPRYSGKIKKIASPALLTLACAPTGWDNSGRRRCPGRNGGCSEYCPPKILSWPGTETSWRAKPPGEKNILAIPPATGAAGGDDAQRVAQSNPTAPNTTFVTLMQEEF